MAWKTKAVLIRKESKIDIFYYVKYEKKFGLFKPNAEMFCHGHELAWNAKPDLSLCKGDLNSRKIPF